MGHWSGGDAVKNKCMHKDKCKSLSSSWCIDCKQFNGEKSKMEELILLPFGVLIERNNIMENSILLPNGKNTLWWEDNGVGGRRYYSDECGDGVLVWDTCLVDIDTLIKAFEIENSFVLRDIELILKSGKI